MYQSGTSWVMAACIHVGLLEVTIAHFGGLFNLYLIKTQLCLSTCTRKVNCFLAWSHHIWLCEERMYQNCGTIYWVAWLVVPYLFFWCLRAATLRLVVPYLSFCTPIVSQLWEQLLLGRLTACLPGFQSGWFTPAEKQIGEPQPTRRPAKTFDLLN